MVPCGPAPDSGTGRPAGWAEPPASGRPSDPAARPLLAGAVAPGIEPGEVASSSSTAGRGPSVSRMATRVAAVTASGSKRSSGPGGVDDAARGGAVDGSGPTRLAR